MTGTDGPTKRCCERPCSTWSVEAVARWPISPKRGDEPSQARDMLQAAGEKGYLTLGTRGKTSRALTDKAKELLSKKESGS